MLVAVGVDVRVGNSRAIAGIGINVAVAVMGIVSVPVVLAPGLGTGGSVPLARAGDVADGKVDLFV